MLGKPTKLMVKRGLNQTKNSKILTMKRDKVNEKIQNFQT